MPKRHVILVEKTSGEHAVLAAETMRELGLADGDAVVVIAPATGPSVLPVKGGNIGPGEIKLPRRTALVMKEGERVSVEPSPEPAPPLPPPVPAPQFRQSGHAQQGQVEWDPVTAGDFDEIAGLEKVKDRIEQAIFYLTHPEWFLIRKSLPPRVFLFFGPYGCGKTMLAKGMASRLAHGGRGGCKLDIKAKCLRSTDVKDPYLGMSAKHMQQYLTAARRASDNGSTVLLVLDEIDSLVGNRSDGQTHEEYRDVINSIIQEVQGVHELDTESRIRRLWKDKKVEEVRGHIAEVVRKQGKRDQKSGDIFLPEKEWTEEIREGMMALRGRVIDEGGVSTVIIVGTTNDPTRVDEAFLSRAGDNVFFVPRPSEEAIEQMLRQYLDSTFVELSDAERRKLAHAAFAAGLTGRDIVLGWLQPLAQATPGSLRIVGYHTIKSQQPRPQVGIEWEMDLYRRLQAKGQLFMAEQVAEYLAAVQSAGPDSKDAPVDHHANGAGQPGQKQPALLDS